MRLPELPIDLLENPEDLIAEECFGSSLLTHSQLKNSIIGCVYIEYNTGSLGVTSRIGNLIYVETANNSMNILMSEVNYEYLESIRVKNPIVIDKKNDYHNIILFLPNSSTERIYARVAIIKIEYVMSAVEYLYRIYVIKEVDG